MDRQYHVSGMEPDACVGMGGDIVEELVTCLLEGLGAVCLVYWDCVECGKEGGVNGAPVVEECAYDALDGFDFFFSQWGRVILLHPLNFCAILDRCGFEGGILWCCWWRVLVFGECLRDVSRHVCVDVAVDVIPCEFDSAEECALSVDFYCVVFPQCLF